MKMSNRMRPQNASNVAAVICGERFTRSEVAAFVFRINMNEEVKVDEVLDDGVLAVRYVGSDNVFNIHRTAITSYHL